MDTINFKYVGLTYKNCSPSGAQQASLKSITDMHRTMDTSYKTLFGLGSKMYQSLKSGYDKIVNTTHGMSPEELAARNAQATNQAAASSQQVQRAIGSRAAMTGAVPGVESGIVQSERAAADTAILGTEASQKASITAQDYDIGRKERDTAMSAEAKLGAETFAPATEAAGADISSAKEQSEQANANAAASSSWMGLVGGLASSAIGAAGMAEGCVTLFTRILMADQSFKTAKNIQFGDQLHGFDGPEFVRSAEESIQPCVRITLDNDRTIEVSESHTFFSPTGGYVEAIESLDRYLMTQDAHNKVVKVEKIEAQRVIKICLSRSHGFVSNGIWSLE